jgi:acyl-CoA thioester hydrolase
LIRVEKVCHRYACEVAFSDTDASGRAHFSRILVFVERAEHDFLRQAGIEVFSEGGWPRVRVSCDYRKPLVFQDRIEVSLALKKVGHASLTWGFEITKGGAELVATGEMVTVKVDRKGAPAVVTEAERIILGGGS